MARANIRVDAVCLAFVDTPMVRGVASGDARALEALARFQPIGRMATPEEIASGIAWLLADEASFVAGSVITMAGGATA